MGCSRPAVCGFTALFIMILGLGGCGSRSSNVPPSPQVPASISLIPASNLSLELGAQQSFGVTVRSSANTIIAIPVTLVSSNTAVLTIANNGVSCAGTWNSLVNPSVCTPGPTGVSVVTATAQGVTSPPTTVYVHQHIDNIAISPVNPITVPCFSQGQTALYQAAALSAGVDITSTVGPFLWSPANGTVLKLDNTLTTLLANQVQATAENPGQTTFEVSAAGVNSAPIQFETCPVQSISLAVTNTTDTSFTIAAGGSKAITATVLDSMGVTLNNPPLTWSTSNAGVATVSTTGTVSAVAAGAADIIASCTPPSCNTGFVPSLPVYPSQVIVANVSAPTTAPSVTTWVSTTQCQNLLGCTANIRSLVTSSAGATTFGVSAALPGSPNSFLFNPQGSAGFLGSQKSLMVLNPTANPPTVNNVTTVMGKVLAVSYDGTRVITSDTQSVPNQVFIYNSANTSVAPVNLPIEGASAAAFSLDGLKAYIVANPSSGSTLYVYSTVDSLKTYPLSGPATSLSASHSGAFMYLAGGNTVPTVSARIVCSNATADTVSTPGLATMLQTVPDGVHFLALDPPYIDEITATVTITPSVCSPAVSDTVSSTNLGQGSFTLLKMILSADGRQAFILSSDIGSVLVYNVAGRVTSSIPLVNNATPVSASATLDATLLFVGGSDGAVHVLNAVAGGDTQQIPFPTDLCNNVSFTCTPDLIAVRP